LAAIRSAWSARAWLAAQDAALVVVLAQGIDRRRAVTPAHRDDRQLADEVASRLEDHRDAAQGFEGRPGLGGVLHPALTLAVIAFAPGLHQRRRAHLGEGGGSLLRRRSRGESHSGHAVGVQEALLLDPVLGDGQGAGARDHLDALLGQAGHRRGRHVFELVGDHA
jgi:hypothetical protein